MERGKVKTPKIKRMTGMKVEWGGKEGKKGKNERRLTCGSRGRTRRPTI
jgi:hypothetical protein